MSKHLAALPSVDSLLRLPAGELLVAGHGRTAALAALRAVLAARRAAPGNGADHSREALQKAVLSEAAERLAAEGRSTVRPVFNLTGTVLHTNLGRAVLPSEAIEAVARAAAGPGSLEFDLENGRRGDRERDVTALLCRLTGAEAATLVNNNAAAVLLALNSLALRKEVPISRGELIEIGGAFRMPDIMARAGCRMREVGTTNRTHLSDYEAAIGPRSALLMKVHTSNYLVQGFTAAVPEQTLAKLAHAHGLPLVTDLGSGALIDLARYGLPAEPTPMAALAAGADLVTFSGDKLLGGPQAGLIVGRRDLIDHLKRNPMKRALRADKMTIAALGAVLRLYEDPDSLARRLPTLRQLTRSEAEIQALAKELAPQVNATLPAGYSLRVAACRSEVGSGALPGGSLDSAGFAIEPPPGRGQGAALKRLAAAFRRLPVPVIGRTAEGTFWLDLRCLEDRSAFLEQLPDLATALERKA